MVLGTWRYSVPLCTRYFDELGPWGYPVIGSTRYFEVLGPLQISLARMLGDITRFLVLFTLVYDTHSYCNDQNKWSVVRPTPTSTAKQKKLFNQIVSITC